MSQVVADIQLYNAQNFLFSVWLTRPDIRSIVTIVKHVDMK